MCRTFNRKNKSCGIDPVEPAFRGLRWSRPEDGCLRPGLWFLRAVVLPSPAALEEVSPAGRAGIRDFVEEQRSPVGRFNQAPAVHRGSRE